QREGKAATPYLMVLVRPCGISAYSLLRAALEGLEIDFGYELIDDDWILDFSPEALASAPPSVPSLPTNAAPPLPKRVASLSLGGGSPGTGTGGGGSPGTGNGGGGLPGTGNGGGTSSGSGAGVRSGDGAGFGPGNGPGGWGPGGAGGGGKTNVLG